MAWSLLAQVHSAHAVPSLPKSLNLPGFAGLIAAHRYLDLHPTASLVILDRNTSIGGVWSVDRLYPGFFTQFVTGLGEFSDLKMSDPPSEDCVGDCFKAKWMNRYLEEFAEKMVHDGKRLVERFRRAEVVDVSRGESKSSPDWRIEYRDLSGHDDMRALTGHDGQAHVDIQGREAGTRIIKAEKVIIAAGEFSTPNIPRFRQSSEFHAPIIHSTNFGESNLLSSPNTKHVAVMGAGKSSADMLYICLKTLPPLTTLHWIIREDGTGPGFFAPLDISSPYEESR